MSAPDLVGRVEAVEGRGGRLFVSRTGAADIRTFYGEPWRDDDRLRRGWSASLQRMAKLANEIGARLLVLVPPDAHTLHADDLPEGWRCARPSAADSFAHMFGATVEVVLLRDVLAQSGAAAPMWRTTDSHWAAPGAYVAYRETMERLRSLNPRVLQPEDFALAWAEEAGDLGAVMQPPRRDWTPRVTLRAPRSRVVLDRFDHRRHALKITEVDDPALPSAVIFRDSFATEMAPFLAESFRRTVFVGAQARAFPDLVRDERPDVIVIERAERALPHGVIDWDLLTWREHWPEPGGGAAEADAARAEREAGRALDAGDPALAQVHAREALRLGPTPDRALLLGRAQLAGGDAGAAAESLGSALAADPARWSFLMHLGIVRLAQARPADARDLFARACALAPWRPHGFEHFGYASLACGDAAAARPALEHAVAIGPELPGAWVWLLQALERLGDAPALLRAREVACAAPVDIPGLHA